MTFLLLAPEFLSEKAKINNCDNGRAYSVGLKRDIFCVFPWRKKKRKKRFFFRQGVEKGLKMASGGIKD